MWWCIIFSFSSKQADLLPGVFGLWVCPVCSGRPVHSCLSAVRQDWYREHLLWYVHAIILQGSKDHVAPCTHTELGSGKTLDENNNQNYWYTHCCVHLKWLLSSGCWEMLLALRCLGKHLEIDFRLWSNSSSRHNRPKMADCGTWSSPVDWIGLFYVYKVSGVASPGLCVWYFWRKTVVVASSAHRTHKQWR